MGEVDDEVGRNLLDEAQTIGEGSYRIDIEPHTLEAGDEAVEILLVPAEGVIKSSDEEHLLRPLVIVAHLPEIGLIVGELLEGYILVQMIVDIGRTRGYRIRLRSEPALPVDILTYVER